MQSTNLCFWAMAQNGIEFNSNDDEISTAAQQQQHKLRVTRLNKLSQ